MQVIALKDNDSLAAMLAAEVEADLLILMSDVDGIYTRPPSQEGARLIHTFTPDMLKTITFGKKSKVGTGGMDSKVCQSSSYDNIARCFCLETIKRHLNSSLSSAKEVEAYFNSLSLECDS